MHSYYAENKEKLKKGLSRFMQLVKLELEKAGGKNEAEAYHIVSEEMWKFLDPSAM